MSYIDTSVIDVQNIEGNEHYNKTNVPVKFATYKNDLLSFKYLIGEELDPCIGDPCTGENPEPLDVDGMVVFLEKEKKIYHNNVYYGGDTVFDLTTTDPSLNKTHGVLINGELLEPSIVKTLRYVINSINKAEIPQIKYNEMVYDSYMPYSIFKKLYTYQSYDIKYNSEYTYFFVSNSPDISGNFELLQLNIQKDLGWDLWEVPDGSISILFDTLTLNTTNTNNIGVADLRLNSLPSDVNSLDAGEITNLLNIVKNIDNIQQVRCNIANQEQYVHGDSTISNNYLYTYQGITTEGRYYFLADIDASLIYNYFYVKPSNNNGIDDISFGASLLQDNMYEATISYKGLMSSIDKRYLDNINQLYIKVDNSSISKIYYKSSSTTYSALVFTQILNQFKHTINLYNGLTLLILEIDNVFLYPTQVKLDGTTAIIINYVQYNYDEFSIRYITVTLKSTVQTSSIQISKWTTIADKVQMEELQ